MNSSSVGYTWDPSYHGSNITVLPDRPDTIRREPAKQQTDGAQGQYGYSEGRHLFEFAFNEKPWGSHCGVGLCTRDAATSMKGWKSVLSKIHFMVEIIL